jgi:hypothetical protein
MQLLARFTKRTSRRAFSDFRNIKTIPLGDKNQQKEFLELLRKQESLSNEKHPDYVEFEKEFQGNVNVKTGEVGGPQGKEPTRYGDWERNGRVYDF